MKYAKIYQFVEHVVWYVTYTRQSHRMQGEW